MIHFQNYEEYLEFKNRRKKQLTEQEKAAFREEGSQEGEKRRNRTELVMENNTIYEIDTDCEECLKSFWRWKAAEQDERR